MQTLQQERVPVSKYQQLLASEEPQRHDDATPTDAGRAASDRHQRARGGAQAGGEACRERDGPRAADEAQRRCDTGDSEEDPCEEAAVALDSGGGPAHFTDFCKAVLHPRSVVQVPVPAAAAGCGFGDLHASGAAAAEVPEPSRAACWLMFCGRSLHASVLAWSGVCAAACLAQTFSWLAEFQAMQLSQLNCALRPRAPWHSDCLSSAHQNQPIRVQ